MLRISQLKFPIHTNFDNNNTPNRNIDYFGRKPKGQMEIQKNHPKNSSEHNALKALILKYLKIAEAELLDFKIVKKSLDARKKPNLYHVFSVDVTLKNEAHVLKKKIKNINIINEKPYILPALSKKPLKNPPIIIGFGPAGIFCAYILAKCGYNPVVLERGTDVDQRIKNVEAFWEEGVLNENSNVQFGEGGAGTFSDGKLNTLVKDKFGRNRFVLETLVEHGAPEHILYEQKPHVGTDLLANVVKNIRKTIIKLGGTIHFHTKVEAIQINQSTLGNVKFTIETCQTEKNMNPISVDAKTYYSDILVLAIGHSARDTFRHLHELKVPMEAKSFAVGLRIEHPQTLIDESQYGFTRAQGNLTDLDTEKKFSLPPATYKMAEQLENGRGVYTFCMCPGGYVVNASSEKEKLAINGMSYQARAGVNANAAIVVTVDPKDYTKEDKPNDLKSIHPLAGIKFQEKLEKNAYKIGEGKIPVQRFLDYCQNKTTTTLGDITPSTKGSWHSADLNAIFPDYLNQSLKEGISKMDQKIKGFAHDDAVLSGVESRTSSPVRILRDENMESFIKGLYPCGEGAGYAGGITSAAMDGMKVAEAILHTEA